MITEIFALEIKIESRGVVRTSLKKIHLRRPPPPPPPLTLTLTTTTSFMQRTPTLVRVPRPAHGRPIARTRVPPGLCCSSTNCPLLGEGNKSLKLAIGRAMWHIICAPVTLKESFFAPLSPPLSMRARQPHQRTSSIIAWRHTCILASLTQPLYRCSCRRHFPIWYTR